MHLTYCHQFLIFHGHLRFILLFSLNFFCVLCGGNQSIINNFLALTLTLIEKVFLERKIKIQIHGTKDDKKNFFTFFLH